MGAGGSGRVLNLPRLKWVNFGQMMVVEHQLTRRLVPCMLGAHLARLCPVHSNGRARDGHIQPRRREDPASAQSGLIGLDEGLCDGDGGETTPREPVDGDEGQPSACALSHQRVHQSRGPAGSSG